MTGSAELLKRLQVRAGARLLVINVPKLIGDHLLAGAEVESVLLGEAFDGVIAFCEDAAAVSLVVENALPGLPIDGLLWLAYRKGLAGKISGLTRDTGWDVLTNLGWETVRSISIDETWTGLRFRKAEFVRYRGDSLGRMRS